MTDNIKKLKAWLESDQCKAHDVVPVRVVIEGESWLGCRYKQTRTYTADMDGVRWGKFKAGDTYVIDAIYLLGRIPKVYGKPPRSGKNAVVRVKNVCFPFEGLDWYVGAYMQGNIPPKTVSFHPFGISFILCPWDIKDSKIDAYEPKPYTRYEMTVETI